MTWVRFDDQFPIHRKVGGLSDALYRLHTEAIFWCARNTTDGVIRRDELSLLGARAKPGRAAELVARNMWHAANDLCAQCKEALFEAGTPVPPDGWVIHDYLTFQPSRAKVAHERTAKAERQSKWLASKKNSRHDKDASQGASSDALEDVAPRDANPAPPRPEGSGAGPRAPSRRRAVPGGGGGRDPENPDWRTLPAIGVARDQRDVERTLRGVAAVRAEIHKPKGAAS